MVNMNQIGVVIGKVTMKVKLAFPHGCSLAKAIYNYKSLEIIKLIFRLENAIIIYQNE